MATLVSKDTSGIYLPAEGEAEVTARRTRSFKSFHRGGRSYRVAGQIGPIHYRLDPFDEAEEYQEIDLDLVPGSGEWDWANETNGFQAYFRTAQALPVRTLRFIAKYQRAGGWVLMRPLLLRYENDVGEAQLVGVPLATDPPEIDHEAGTIIWRNAFRSGIDFGYRRMPDRFQKLLIIQTQEALPRPRIDTAGLRLLLVMALTWLPGIRAGNGFAEGIKLDQGLDFDGSLLDAIDERRDDPERFAFLDALDRECFWMQQPRGWDSAEEQHAIAVSWSLVRRLGRVGCRVSVSYADLTSGALTYPLFIDTAISEEQVGAQADDARNYGVTWPGDGYYSHTQTYHQIAGHNYSYFMISGDRFQSVPIPQGAAIDSAVLSFCSYNNTTYAMDADIACENVDSAGAFSPGTREPYDSYLSRTSAVAEWVIPAGQATWSTGSWYDTSDLSAPVQEVVSRSGWAANHDLLFVLWDHTTSLGPTSNKTQRTWDYGASHVDGAKLNCSYTEAGPSGWVMVIRPDD